MGVWIRDAGAEDTDALGALFYRAIHEGAAPRYSEAERAAWAPSQPSGESWAKRLEGLEIVMAEEGGTLLGFMGLNAAGYLDMAFVAPEARGKGISDALYAVLESRARAAKLPALTTHASLMAQSFFARHGWDVCAQERVERAGQQLQRYVLRKPLAA